MVRLYTAVVLLMQADDVESGREESFAKHVLQLDLSQCQTNSCALRVCVDLTSLSCSVRQRQVETRGRLVDHTRSRWAQYRRFALKPPFERQQQADLGPPVLWPLTAPDAQPALHANGELMTDSQAQPCPGVTTRVRSVGLTKRRKDGGPQVGGDADPSVANRDDELGSSVERFGGLYLKLDQYVALRGEFQGVAAIQRRSQLIHFCQRQDRPNPLDEVHDDAGQVHLVPPYHCGHVLFDVEYDLDLGRVAGILLMLDREQLVQVHELVRAGPTEMWRRTPSSNAFGKIPDVDRLGSSLGFGVGLL